jgi:two-component system OmpR family response regulator
MGPTPPRKADGSALRALVVDDERDLADVLTSMLNHEGWTARAAYDVSSALAVSAEFEPDAVILDVALPDGDGFEVLRALRGLNPAVCVLFLTARDSVEDRIAGITAGGDDYVTKPFSMQEVHARLRGIVRRTGVAAVATADDHPDSALVVGDLVMHEDAREVSRAGEPIELTATEFELLRFLMLNPRRVLSKSQILDRVWSYDFGGRAHVVELYISYLRRKIDRGRAPMIHTVRSVGYVLKPAIEPATEPAS